MQMVIDTTRPPVEQCDPPAYGGDRRAPYAAVDTARELSSLGVNASAHTVDVGDGDAMRALAEDVVATHGGCHVLVNNAGVTSAGSFEAESDDDLHCEPSCDGAQLVIWMLRRMAGGRFGGVPLGPAGSIG